MRDVVPARSGEELFLSQLETIERVIAFVCRRRQLSDDEGEEFAAHVRLKLVEGNYAICTKFEGRCSLRTYLTVVIQRLFLDYRIAAWGRWRHSVQAKRLGQPALWLEQLLERDGHTFDEACEILRAKHGVTLSRGDLEHLAASLPLRVKRKVEGDEALSSLHASNTGADRLVEEYEGERAASRVSAVLRQHMATLDAQDRLILVMHFEDGRTITDIATTLRVERQPLYRRVDRLLTDFRHALEREGIDASVATDLVDRGAASLDWKPVPVPKTGDRRPSIKNGDV